MTKPPEPPLIGRRQLVGALGAAAITPLLGSSTALAEGDVPGWDTSTDVLVVGSGAAGACAAIEASMAGAQALVIESLPKFGGSSAMSAGVVYAGAGTALQRAVGVQDTVEAMYRFISLAGGPHPDLEKVRLYCEDSPAHFDWLQKQGIKYTEKFSAAKGVPMDDASLYFSGNELAWPSIELATPAPRGHVPGQPGMNGGRHLMMVLLARLGSLGVSTQAGVSAQRLVLASDGRVLGMQVMSDGQRKSIRARRAVVLASGGFIHNREMVRNYAPRLYDCSVPWGNAGDLGSGINIGIGAGAAALRMDQGFAIAPLYPPDNVLAGIVVNSFGQRFIAEDSYHGVLGDAIAYHQRGRAWLITDQGSNFPGPQDNFPLAAQGNSIGDLAEQLDFPRGALQDTVAYYNRHAANGEDSLFHKNQQYLRPIQGPPYRAWDLSVDKAFFPAHTFGGLHTGLSGRVLNSFGQEIPGLYAAGRTSSGLPGAPYIASGLSVGDCTYFGRRAGAAAAADPIS